MNDPQTTGARGKRLTHPLAVVLACLALYLVSMPRTVALEDDGLLILAAWYNGVAHPPGYPLFTLIAHAFTQFPWGTVAARAHAVSALFGALAMGVLWGVARELGLSRWIATTVALMLGVSAVFWSQSIIAEVYSLNCFLVLLALFLALRLRNATSAMERKRLAPAMGLTLGLGLANHWPLVLLTAPGVLAMLWPALRKSWRDAPLGVLALLLGLTPYLWMYLRSQQAPFISFYGPLNDLGDLIFLISRAGYGDIDTSPSAGWGDKLGYLLFFLRELVRQFSVVAVPLMLVGAWRQFRRLPLGIALGLSWIFFANSLLLILLLNFDHEPLFESVFRVYPLLSYTIAVLWIGIGLAELTSLTARLATAQARLVIPPLIASLLLCATLATAAPTNLRQGYQWTNWYAEYFLHGLEQDAVVFVDGDIEAGVIGYFRYVEGWRPDVDLFSSVGRVFGTRIFEPLHVDPDGQRAALDAFLVSGDRPIYYASDFLSPPHGHVDHWLYRRLEVSLGPQTAILPDPQPWLAFLDLVLQAESELDQWTRFHRQGLLRAIVPHLTNHFASETSSQRAERYRAALGRVVDASPSAELAWVRELIYRYPQQRAPRDLVEQLKRLHDRPWAALSKREHALVDYLLGVLYQRTGDEDSARHWYDSAMRRWRHPDNPAAAERPVDGQHAG